MKKIKTYNNYITESKTKLVLTEDQLLYYIGKYYDFLKDYFKDNPAIKIKESSITNGCNLEVSNGNTNNEIIILSLDIKYNNEIELTTVQDEYILLYLNNTESNFEIIKQYLDSYYDILKVQTSHIDLYVYEIPVVNIDKYIDFLYDIYLNFNKYDFLVSNYTKKEMLEDIQELDVMIDYKIIENKFKEKFNHIINASNFDLI
jgi:hypothetical protein